MDSNCPEHDRPLRGDHNDHQWIHIDPERARAESPFGTTIPHGFLTLSLGTSPSHQAFKVQHNLKMTINYGLNRVHFVSPVRCGSRIHGRFAPKEVGDNQVIWLVTVEIEGSEKNRPSSPNGSAASTSKRAWLPSNENWCCSTIFARALKRSFPEMPRAVSSEPEVYEGLRADAWTDEAIMQAPLAQIT